MELWPWVVFRISKKSTDRIHNVPEQGNGKETGSGEARVSFQEAIRLPVCCLQPEGWPSAIFNDAAVRREVNAIVSRMATGEVS